MSGSGKTTYVLKNKKAEDIILDLDYLKKCFNNQIKVSILKELQIKLISYFLSKNIDVWYITCFPSKEELASFPSDCEYLWINTNYEKCSQNIRKRDVKSGKTAQDQLIDFNRKVLEKYKVSNIDFKILDIFDSGERWQNGKN